MARTTLLVLALVLACGLLIFTRASAHEGLDQPFNPDKPFSADYTCELPLEAEPVDVSYHVWMALVEPTDIQLLANCTRIDLAQKILEDESLHVRFFDDPGGNPLDCESLPVSVVSDTSAIKDINQLALDIHSWKADWDDLTDFIDEARNDHYFDDKVNVYVLADAVFDANPEAEFRGMHVRDKEHTGHLIFIPERATDDTFVHEFGHAFSLNHVNFLSFFDRKNKNKPLTSSSEGERPEYCIEYDGWDGVCDFRETNLMWSRRDDRTDLTMGQKLRMVCNDWSSLNFHGDRPDGSDVFKCPDWTVVDLDSLVDDKEGHTHCPVLHDGVYTHMLAP